jgi:hypothetical protein
MKLHALVLIIVAAAFHATAQDTIVNRGMEHWTDYGNYEEPDNWQTANGALANIPGNTQFTVVKSSNPHTGDYAARLENLHYTVLGQAVPGVMTNGRFDLSPSFEPVFNGGQPFSSRPERITGHYRYLPKGSDTCAIFGVLTRYDTMSNTRDTIAFGAFLGSDTAQTYEEFKLHFNYYSPLDPDTLLVVATSSVKMDPPPNSILLIDDLAIVSVTGTQSLLGNEAVKVYPTVASSRLFVEGADQAFMSIYDLTGRRVVSRKQIDGQGIPLQSLDPGMFVYRLVTSDGRVLKTGKFVYAGN